ncbi:hypothetical protein QT972_00140 [Microcoleus sp. herbarium7]|uniref:hypothetical protein n=1 Tax=Microcoleus sp. herbarium7 TaxID=3055435 RepID=UPI002FD374B4
MLEQAEKRINQSIGRFSTIPQVYGYQYFVDSYNLSNEGILPGQCRAFITSSIEFIWFIESWDVVESATNSAPEVPKITLQNKRIYPAKVTGINLPSLVGGVINWREGLINSISSYDNSIGFRPGFGETILTDLSRPLKSVTVVKNTLGLPDIGGAGFYFSGPLGRLMSTAVKIDKKKAAEYDASQSKKKKKSLNSQDYEQMPTYPAYTPYVNDTGY